MKVDKIETQYGDIDVEYSAFTKGFFVKKFPEKFEKINGLKLYTNRDNSFKTFEQLRAYVFDIIKDAKIDFVFEKKVILYYLKACEHYNSLQFEYLICDKSAKTQRYLGKDNVLNEYIVLESSQKSMVGKRNILGQILFSSTNSYVEIDYDQEVHNFIINFHENFMKLREQISSFFSEETFVLNVKNNYLSLPLANNKD